MVSTLVPTLQENRWPGSTAWFSAREWNETLRYRVSEEGRSIYI